MKNNILEVYAQRERSGSKQTFKGVKLFVKICLVDVAVCTCRGIIGLEVAKLRKGLRAHSVYWLRSRVRWKLWYWYQDKVDQKSVVENQS